MLIIRYRHNVDKCSAILGLDCERNPSITDMRKSTLDAIETTSGLQMVSIVLLRTLAMLSLLGVKDDTSGVCLAIKSHVLIWTLPSCSPLGLKLLLSIVARWKPYEQLSKQLSKHQVRQSDLELTQITGPGLMSSLEYLLKNRSEPQCSII